MSDFDTELAELLVGDRLDERGEQGDGGDDGGADGEALGDGLGGVAHRVEAHHDALRLTAELAGHLGDAGGVVGHGPNVSSETTTPVVASMPMPASATR